jgi:hypothetical protein
VALAVPLSAAWLVEAKALLSVAERVRPVAQRLVPPLLPARVTIPTEPAETAPSERRFLRTDEGV